MVVILMLGSRRFSRIILRHLSAARQHSIQTSRPISDASSILHYDRDIKANIVDKSESATFTSVANAVDVNESEVWGKSYDMSTAFDEIIRSLERRSVQNVEQVPKQYEAVANCGTQNTESTTRTAHDAIYQRQLDIERRQMALANINTVGGVQSLTAMGKGANLKAVQRALLYWYEPFIKALNEEVRLAKEGVSGTDRTIYGPVLCIVPVEKLAVITIHATMNAVLANQNTGAAVARLTKDIAASVQTECHVAALAADKTWLGKLHKEKAAGAQGNPKAIRLLSKHLRKYLDEAEWSSSTKMKIGGFLINALKESAKDEKGMPALVHSTPWVGPNKQVGIIRLTDATYRAITENTLYYGEPTFLPMLVPPMPWKSDLTGAYFTLRANILRYRSKSQLHVLRNARMEPLLDGLNYLAEIPWQVNIEVLDTIKTLYNRGETVEGIPSRVDVPLPDQSECLVSPDKLPRSLQRKREKEAAEKASAEGLEGVDEGEDELVFDNYYFNYITKKIVQKNMATHSLRCDLEIKLRIAEEFKKDTIYFPWNMDFRGRAYPIPQNFNHMGSDLCRGLLTFAKSKPLGPKGLDWLKCHLCNLCGNNKISTTDRIAWADTHMDDIIDSATRPVEGNRWWAKAENPFQALAACIEIHRAIQSGDPETYECSLPVHQDGSCNGLQHYAAMGKDKPGGRAVNLLPSDKPQDVYSEVLVLVLDAIEKDCEEIVDASKPADVKRQRCARTIRGKVDRKVIKQTVMTSVYGVTPIGARLQIGARLREKLYGDAEVTLDQEQDQVVYDAAQ